jgi:hypothetical protein
MTQPIELQVWHWFFIGCLMFAAALAVLIRGES